MRVLVSLSALEIMIVLLLYPMRFVIKAHFVLNMQKFVCELRLANIAILRIKCTFVNEIKVYINGKIKKRTKSKMSAKYIKKCAEIILNDIVHMDICAFLGGEAKNNAILCALLNSILQMGDIRAYSSACGEKTDMDTQIRLKITILDIAKIAILLLSANNRSKYARF